MGYVTRSAMDEDEEDGSRLGRSVSLKICMLAATFRRDVDLGGGEVAGGLSEESETVGEGGVSMGGGKDARERDGIRASGVFRAVGRGLSNSSSR